MTTVGTMMIGHPSVPELAYGVTPYVHPKTQEPVILITQAIPHEQFLIAMADEKHTMLWIPVNSFPQFQQALRQQARLARNMAQGSVHIIGNIGSKPE